MLNLMKLYEEYLIGRGLKQSSIIRKKHEVNRFLKWCKEIEVNDIREINDKVLEQYFIYLKDAKLSTSTQITASSSVKDLFYVLDFHELILINPFDKVEILLKNEHSYKEVLSENEMKVFLESIEPDTGFGLRDRCIFELMYIAGLRISEVVNLNTDDIDFSLNEIMIRNSKNGKDRIVPLGRISGEYLKVWIKKSRNWFKSQTGESALFLSRKKKRISISAVRVLFKRYIEKAGIKRKGLTPHSIRHSTATHLLEHGADIRFVQSLLGHECIETTTGYTRGVVNSLKKMYKSHHPRENSIYSED